MSAFYPTCQEDQDIFSDPDEAYATIKARLRSAEWGELKHAELERRLSTDGMELLRRLLQSHYTLRGQGEPVMSVVGADGAERTHVREGTCRQVETIFGTVEAKRTAYSGRGLSALHPVDADLGLPDGKFSQEVERQVALGAAGNSFDETASLIERTTAASVAKRQVEELAQSAAEDFTTFYAKREFDPVGAGETGPLLILSFDQKGVVMRPEDLLDATRKIAEGELRKLESRYCKGEPHGRKRMSTVATVYSIQPHVRTEQDVINGLRRIRDVSPQPKPRPEVKRLWASLQEAPEDVIKAAFEEALKRDPERTKRWIVLIDGDEKLETWVNQAAKDYAVQITIGLDVIHALQYLWKAGKSFHTEGTPELESWVLERLLNVLHGKASDVAAGMRRSATLRGLKGKERKAVDRCARYFLKRTHLMRYDTLLDLGAPIATGVVEGGCKYLINDRLDASSARWSLSGAEAILRLRALVISGDFDEYWQVHEEQAQKRNHDSRYAGGQAPQIALPARRNRNLRLVKS